MLQMRGGKHINPHRLALDTTEMGQSHESQATKISTIKSQKVSTTTGMLGIILRQEPFLALTPQEQKMDSNTGIRSGPSQPCLADMELDHIKQSWAWEMHPALNNTPEVRIMEPFD